MGISEDLSYDNTSIKNIKIRDYKPVNLRSVKSLYIIDNIFSFLNEKNKLNMIIYNKKYQKLFGINIEQYKKLTGKYKVGERNGIGKEYLLNKNILIFEGEYLNGKKNGYGKEFYDNGKLKFEGKYLNGYKIEGKGYNCNDNEILRLNRNGKGKEYYNNGKLQFEGEYLNGKRWNGKGYDKNGLLEFEIKNGFGKGKEYDYNGKLEFVGEYLNRERKGKGKEYFNNGKL